MVLVGYGVDPEVDPYFWTSKTTDGFKSSIDSDLTALNAKIYEKCAASLRVIWNILHVTLFAKTLTDYRKK